MTSRLNAKTDENENEKGTLVTHEISPSQVQAAERCLRRWWWQSVKGYKAPPSPQTEFGGAVHAALEAKILHRHWPADVDPEVLKRAQAAYTALCKHWGQVDLFADHHFVERDWRIEAGAATYPLAARGRIDLVSSINNAAVDWKTTSDTKWIKTEDDRATDAQTVMYVEALVADGMLTLPTQFLHVYTVTKGTPTGIVAVTEVTAESLSIGRRKIKATVDRMVGVLALGDVGRERVEHNPLACRDFGGCPHYDRCFGAEGEQQEQESNMNMQDLKASLAARRAAQQGSAPALINPPDAPTPVPVTPEAVVAAVEAGMAAVVEGAKPGKARKTKATEVQSLPSSQGSFADRAAQATVAEVPVLLPSGPQILLIGCAPLVTAGSDFVLGDVWLQQFAQKACESLKVPYWALADFGKGGAAIAALVADAAQRGDLPPRLILDRRSALADKVAEILIPHYPQVFAKLG